MENFNLLDGSDTLKASRDTINNNLLSVRSLSSGTAFPTDNLSVGMLCYRTDLKRLYQYQENGSWSEDIAMNINGNANTANSAGTAHRATVADSCTGNSATATTAETAETCTGNSATATKLKSAISINNVAFDGTKNINIPVGVKTVNGIEPSADGDVVVAGVPIGFEYISFNPNIPTGSIPLLGGTFSRTAYKDLWAWVQTQGSYLVSEAEWQAKATANEGNVPFYSTGDGSTTFRVPSLSCWVKGANGVSEVGSYLKAGLPNIEGSWIPVGVSNHSSASDPATGAFTNKAGNTVDSWSRSGSLQTYGFDFNASLSNPIYGNSDTVQPPSIVGMWLVKAFGTVSNIGNQDIADVSAGLTRVEEKMDEYTDNVAYIESFIVETWKSDDGMTWYRKYSDGFIEQGGAISCGTGYQSVTVTLPTAFTTTTYTAMSAAANASKLGDGTDIISGKTTTAFTTHTHYKGDTLPTWYACGY